MLSNFRHISRFIASKSIKPSIYLIRKKSNRESVSDENVSKPLGNMSSKYQVYHDKDSEIILDVYEERLKYSQLLEDEEVEEDRYQGLNLERGIKGVYDIEDLVEVLKREQAQNIFVAAVPNEVVYVEYICIVSGKSVRHMQSIAQFVRRLYKHKRKSNDLLPKIEGERSKDWMALDLGNIALHIFSEKARELYDLESLWSLGSEFDEEYNKPEPVSDMLEKQTIYLKGLEPAS
ncbi:uncharacterized protein K12H4.2 [Diorhabda carinulata]|uniref:uncharacterized protein K12H4.2 n=1 Tax=Diorhabda carinulata TaxID=1163345 RepID=UPI0025A26592|nr:uncharacterized protein K12H4.2 [Diorhabda carinulata]